MRRVLFWTVAVNLALGVIGLALLASAPVAARAQALETAVRLAAGVLG